MEDFQSRRKDEFPGEPTAEYQPTRKIEAEAPYDPAAVHREILRQRGQYKKVFVIMLDGKWRTLEQIRQKLGKGGDASISARLRDIRKPEFGSHTVEKRNPGNGLYAYRLILNPAYALFLEEFKQRETELNSDSADSSVEQIPTRAQNQTQTKTEPETEIIENEKPAASPVAQINAATPPSANEQTSLFDLIPEPTNELQTNF